MWSLRIPEIHKKLEKRSTPCKAPHAYKCGRDSLSEVNETWHVDDVKNYEIFCFDWYTDFVLRATERFQYLAYITYTVHIIQYMGLCIIVEPYTAPIGLV